MIWSFVFFRVGGCRFGFVLFVDVFLFFCLNYFFLCSVWLTQLYYKTVVKSIVTLKRIVIVTLKHKSG